MVERSRCQYAHGSAQRAHPVQVVSSILERQPYFNSNWLFTCKIKQLIKAEKPENCAVIDKHACMNYKYMFQLLRAVCNS